jgi:hypothetical protein
MKKLTRRDFLKLSGTVAAAGLLVGGCGCAAPKPSVSREDVLKFHPDAPSKVVHTHHAGVWTGTPQGFAGDNDLLVPEALRQMLDASITELAGLDDAREAWAAMFHPDERVAIKVNPVFSSNFWTHAPLVVAVTECLQEAGVPAEQIVIYHETTIDLLNAGYPINRDGPGVRCHGTNANWDGRWVYQDEERHGWDTGYVPGWTVAGHDMGLSEILLSCDALINMPILKDHNCGITFALKNHFGSIDKPELCHADIIPAGMVDALKASSFGELNALPPIKDRTRLIIGDLLTIAGANKRGWESWTKAVVGDSILMTFDPVAADTVGLQLFLDAITPEGPVPESIESLTVPWLEHAAELGVGTDDPRNMEVVEVNLT